MQSSLWSPRYQIQVNNTIFSDTNMEFAKDCHERAKKYLKLLQRTIDEKSKTEENYVNFQQTQTAIEAMISEKDKNLDKILDQQRTVRYALESDGRVKALREKIANNQQAIGNLRKACHEQSIRFISMRNQLLQDQAHEVERFQMQQMKSIADDLRRHKTILDTRRKEIATLTTEIENEEKNRLAILKDIESKLDLELRRRQASARGESVLASAASVASDRASGIGGVTDELFNRNHIELGSVDEYAPYGPTITSDVASGRSRGARGGRGSRGGRGGSRGRASKRGASSTQL